MMSPTQDHRLSHPIATQARIAVLMEQHYDHDEWLAFQDFFPAHGYVVDAVSHLWGQPELTFFANAVDGLVPSSCTVRLDVEQLDPRNYDAVLVIGGYAADRLRYEVCPIPGGECQSPAARFLAGAMAHPGTIVGTLCHGVWLLTACRSLLQGRRLTCASNVLRDVENAGGEVVFESGQLAPLVIDADLVTASHPDHLDAFLRAVLSCLLSSAHNSGSD
jgi:putative intracellular protease/amidase